MIPFNIFKAIHRIIYQNKQFPFLKGYPMKISSHDIVIDDQLPTQILISYWEITYLFNSLFICYYNLKARELYESNVLDCCLLLKPGDETQQFRETSYCRVCKMQLCIENSTYLALKLNAILSNFLQSKLECIEFYLLRYQFTLFQTMTYFQQDVKKDRRSDKEVLMHKFIEYDDDDTD